MISLRRFLHRPAVVPVLATALFISCGQQPKHPLGQWPVRAPKDVQYASYQGTQQREGRLSVTVNGAHWEGRLCYQGAELDSVATVQCSSPALEAVLAEEGRNIFSVPLLDEADTAATSDLTERWVSADFEAGGRIITEDINFDGHPDLVLYNALESSLSQRSYHVWLYNAAEKQYYLWNLAARTGGELLGRNRRRRELTLGNADSGHLIYKVVGDTTLQLVKRTQKI